MDTLYASCFGQDVHKDSVTAYPHRVKSRGRVATEVRIFGPPRMSSSASASGCWPPGAHTWRWRARGSTGDRCSIS